MRLLQEQNVKENGNEFNELSSEEKSLFLQKKILSTGLFHPNEGVEFYNYDRIFIDLDSLLSRLTSEELPVETSIRVELIDFIMMTFTEFFKKYSNYSNIFIIYGFKKNKIFNDIYPEWNLDRYKRLENETVVNFIHNNLIKRLKSYSKKVKNVSIIEYKKAFIIDILKILNVFEKEGFNLIISRNPQILTLLAYYNVFIYDGKDVIDRRTCKMIKGYPKVHHSLIPHWFLLRGDKRNGYKGYPRMGPKITDNYIEKHKGDIISFTDERIKTVEKYRKLYFVKELI